MKKIIFNIIALYLGTYAALGQGIDGFLPQEWSNEIRDPEFITLYIAINNFEDPAPMTDGLGILAALTLIYLVTRSFTKKDIER